MSLLENQSYSKKLKFISNDDEEKYISFNISLSCNHEVDKSILVEIEKKINDLILNNYIKFEEHQKLKELQKEQEKLKIENDKLQKKLEQQQKKYEEKVKKEQEKQNKEIKPIFQNKQIIESYKFRKF